VGYPDVILRHFSLVVIDGISWILWRHRVFRNGIGQILVTKSSSQTKRNSVDIGLLIIEHKADSTILRRLFMYVCMYVCMCISISIISISSPNGIAMRRCRSTYILPLWFALLTPKLWGHWTDINQTWTLIWLLF